MHGGIGAGDDSNDDDDDFEPVSPHPVRRRPDLPRPSLKRPRSLASPGKPSLTSSATIPPLTSTWSAKKKGSLSALPPLPGSLPSSVKSSFTSTSTTTTTTTTTTITTNTALSTTPSTSSKGLQRTGSALSLKRAISKNAIPKTADSTPSSLEEPLRIDSPATAAAPISTTPIVINDDSDRIPDSSQEQPSHKPPQTPSKRPKKFKSTETVRQQVVSLTDTPDDNFTSDAIITTINIPMSTLEEQERLNKMQRLQDDQEDDSLQLALAISRSMDHSEDGSAATPTSWSMVPLNSRKGKGRRKVSQQEKNETTVLPVAEVQHLIQANVSALLFPEDPKRSCGTSNDFTEKTPPWPPSRFVGATKADLELSLSQSSETDLGSSKTTLWDLSRFKDEHGIDRLDLDSNQIEGGSSRLDIHEYQDPLQARSSSPVITDRDQYVTRFMAQYLHRDKNVSTTDTQPQSNSSAFREKEDTANVQSEPSSSGRNDDKPTFSSPIWSAPRARRISFKDQSKALDQDFAISLQKEITNHLADMERTIQEAKRVAYRRILRSLQRRPITSRLRSPEPMDLIAADNSNTHNLSQELEQEIIRDGYHPSSSPLLRYSKHLDNNQGAELITNISLENSHQTHDHYSADDYQEDYGAGFLDDNDYQPDFSFELNRADSVHPAGNDDNIQKTIHIASSPLSFPGSQSQKSIRIENSGHASPIDLNETHDSLRAHFSQQQEASPSFSSPVQLPPPLDFAKLGYQGTATQSSTPPRSASPPPAPLSDDGHHSDPPESPWVTTPKRARKTRRLGFDFEVSEKGQNQQGREQGYEPDLRSPVMSDLDDDMDDPPLPRIPSRPRNMFKGKMPVRRGLSSLIPSPRRYQTQSLSPSPPPTPLPQQSQLSQRSKGNPLHGLPLLKKFTIPAVGTSQQHAEAASGVSTLASLHERGADNNNEENRMSPVLDEVEAMSPVLQDEDPYQEESTALSQRLNMSISPQTLSNAMAASSTPRRRRGPSKKNSDGAALAAAADGAEPTPPQTPTKKKKATLRAEALAAQTAKFVANLKAQGARPKYETMSVARLKVLAMTFGLKPSGKIVMVEQLNAIWNKLNPDAGDDHGEKSTEEAVAEAITTSEARGGYRGEGAIDEEDDVFELGADNGAGSLTVPDRQDVASDFLEPLDYDGTVGYDLNQDYEQDQSHYYYDPWEDEQMDNGADSPIRLSPIRVSRGNSPRLTYQFSIDGNDGIDLEEFPVLGLAVNGGGEKVQHSDIESVILSDNEPMEILSDEDDDPSLLSEGSFSQGRSELSVLTDEDADEGEDDLVDQEFGSTSVSGLEDLNRQLGEFLRSTPHLRQQYLTYKPLDLESLWEECQGANIDCTREQIRQFLDKQGIICFVPAHSSLSSWRKKRAGKVNKRRKRIDK